MEILNIFKTVIIITLLLIAIFQFFYILKLKEKSKKMLFDSMNAIEKTSKQNLMIITTNRFDGKYAIRIDDIFCESIQSLKTSQEAKFDITKGVKLDYTTKRLINEFTSFCSINPITAMNLKHNKNYFIKNVFIDISGENFLNIVVCYSNGVDRDFIRNLDEFLEKFSVNYLVIDALNEVFKSLDIYKNLKEIF